MPFANEFTDNRIPSKDELDTVRVRYIDELNTIKKSSFDRKVLEKVDRLLFDLNTIYMGINIDFAKERDRVKESLENIHIRIASLPSVKK